MTDRDACRVLLAHVVDSPEQFAGAERVLEDLATYLVTRGRQHLAVAVNDGVLSERLRNLDGVSLHALPDRSNLIRLRSELRRIVAGTQPDVVSTHHRLITWFLRAHQSDATVIQTVHVYPTRRRRLTWWGDVTVCVSESIRAQLIRDGVRPESAVTIVNGVSDPGLRGRRSSRDGFRIGVVGRLTEQKGQATFLAVLDRLRNHPVQGWVVGDGPDQERLRAAAGANVTFKGFQPMPDVLEEIDAVVMPSLWEGTPLTLLEAWAFGRPVVASRIPGIVEYASNGEALLVEPSDVGGFVAAVEALRTDGALYASTVRAGRAAYEARFSRDEMGAAYLGLFEDVNGTRRVRS